MRQPNKNLINWALFILLSLIWGSSFILMKRGLFSSKGEQTLTAYQVAAIRVLSGGMVLLPIAFRKLSSISKSRLGYIILSALLGSFFPAFLFCIAETKIDSSLAGFLNALTPVFTIVIGIAFFHHSIERHKITGVLIAFAGMTLLFLANKELNLQYYKYAGFVILAVISYGLNANIVNRHLKEVRSTDIAAIGFGALIIPSLIILYFTGYFQLPLGSKAFVVSNIASGLLGILGTALAYILFYMLIKRAGTVFASMVTYGIPFIALGWGLLDGEQVGLLQVAALAVILAGVYRANRKIK